MAWPHHETPQLLAEQNGKTPRGRPRPSEDKIQEATQDQWITDRVDDFLLPVWPPH